MPAYILDLTAHDAWPTTVLHGPPLPADLEAHWPAQVGPSTSSTLHPGLHKAAVLSSVNTWLKHHL